jgi:hypothetical protein
MTSACRVEGSGEVAGDTGGGLFASDCVDASQYTGLQFTVFGTTGGVPYMTNLTFQNVAFYK